MRTPKKIEEDTANKPVQPRGGIDPTDYRVGNVKVPNREAFNQAQARLLSTSPQLEMIAPEAKQAILQRNLLMAQQGRATPAQESAVIQNALTQEPQNVNKPKTFEELTPPAEEPGIIQKGFNKLGEQGVIGENIIREGIGTAGAMAVGTAALAATSIPLLTQGAGLLTAIKSVGVGGTGLLGSYFSAKGIRSKLKGDISAANSITTDELKYMGELIKEVEAGGDYNVAIREYDAHKQEILKAQRDISWITKNEPLLYISDGYNILVELNNKVNQIERIGGLDEQLQIASQMGAINRQRIKLGIQNR